MPRLAPDLARLTTALQARGATGSRALADALGVSQATLSRMIARAGSTVERIGAARSTQYVLRRPVRHFGNQWPVYRIDHNGRPQLWGELRALYGGFRFVPTESETTDWMRREYVNGMFTGLPFFLQDCRPQGYLGRAIAREAAHRLGVPLDLRQWNDDEALTYFLNDGYDLPGDLVVGDHALERALRHVETPAAIPNGDRPRFYPERAAAAQRGELVGSSAGGEQPKFLGTDERSTGEFQSVLVKFSAADPSPVSQRWADLLLCEHLATETMRARQIPCARTEILDSQGRRFLEVERFDRIAAAGRRGLLTLGAVEDAFLDRNAADWAAAAAMLEAAQWIDPEQGRVLRWTWCFGDLIANSDMHRSNASVWFDDTLPFRISPVYDMLPMLYAPGPQGDLSARSFDPRRPLPAVMPVWRDAANAALEFWARVNADARISDSFRVIAAECAERVRHLVNRFS